MEISVCHFIFGGIFLEARYSLISFMKKAKRQNGNQPVTLAVLQRVLAKALAPIYKQFDLIDGRFKQIDKRFGDIDKRFGDVDKRFKEIGGWFQAAQSIHAIYTDRAIGEFEVRLNKKFDNMMSIIDAFLKRTEDNKQEITFRQMPTPF